MEKYDKFYRDKCPCSKTSMLVFEQGNLSWKNLPKIIFASVNYLSNALVKDFPFTLPRKTCQGKTCQGELASVNEALFPEILIKYRNLFLIVTFLRWPTRDMLQIKKLLRIK